MNSLLKTNHVIEAIMQEPEYSCTGLSDDAVDATIVEIKTFLWDRANTDSDVVFSRTREVNAAGDVITASLWEVTNAPVIDDITSDLDDNSTINVDGDTILTISGSNFGANDGDLAVLVRVPVRMTAPAIKSHTVFEAVINSVSVGDDEIVATLTLSYIFGGKVPTTGTCTVEVINTKRFLKSAQFEMTVV